MKQVLFFIGVFTALLVCIRGYDFFTEVPQRIVTAETCDPCLIPRGNIALLNFNQPVEYYYASDDSSFHVGKLNSDTLTIALVKSKPDSSTLTVLTRDTLVMFRLIPDQANIARIYSIK